MKITHIEPVVVRVNHRGDWVFVLVHTDAGLTGLGEASHNTSDRMALASIAQYSEALTGEDPTRIQALWHRMAKRHDGRVAHTVVSAIEQALWDILGQSLGVPIRALLGGAVRERIRLYANINRHVRDRAPAGFARAAEQAVAQGFAAVKLAPFDEVRSADQPRTGPRAGWRAGVERVRAVRAAIGDEVELLVDCHSRFDEAGALAVAEELADCRLYWLEEPLPHTMPDALARVTARAPMATASTESVFGIEAFAPFLTRRVVDFIMPDVKHCGGIMELHRIAGAARATGVLVAPHSPSGPVSTAAGAQVMSTATNFAILEYAWGEADWRADLLDPPERVENGYLHLPEGPGLGHRLNLPVVHAHRAEAASARDSSTALPVS